MKKEKYAVINRQVGTFRVTGYLQTDQNSECPLEWGYGNVEHFTNTNYEELTNKFKNNSWAFLIDCYNHSQVKYSLHNEGPKCSFDSFVSGYYYLNEDAISYITKIEKDPVKQIEFAKKYAREELQTYTDWCNGDVWTAVVVSRTSDTEEVKLEETLWGLYGFENAEKELEECIHNIEQRFKNTLAKRRKKFTDVLKTFTNTLIASKQHPAKYFGLYKYENKPNISNRSIWINSDCAQTIINTINKNNATLLLLIDLDTSAELDFKVGYTLNT